jgi:cell division protein FtsI/penicillin-binding protein 2
VNAEGVGNYGIEGALNERLKGVDGRLRTVTDVRDVPLTIGDKYINTPPKDGDTIVLSIDRNIQSYTEDALKRGIEKAGAKNGSALVMNAKNGRIMAMANYPSYNPAEFWKVKDAADFNNATISAPYEPASVIKTFAMATGIDKGVITPASTYNNTDSIRVDDTVVRNAFLGLTGTITMQDVLNNSLNTGTVTVAQRLGDGRSITRPARDTMYDYFHNRFGLGRVTGVELANESMGLVVSPEQTEGNAVRYSNMTFGQGLDVTMLQVAAGFSSVVNGGMYYTPTVIEGELTGGVMKSTQPQVQRRTVSESTSQDMRSMLVAARRSVSYMRDADKPGYNIGGKTGTAETLRNGRYVKSETVGTYLGFGGATEPEYVIMVQVSAPNRNLEGGLHASPIFTDISNWMIDYLRIPPKG